MCFCLFEFGKRYDQSVAGKGEFIIGYDLLVKQGLLALQFDTCRFHFCLCRTDVGACRAQGCLIGHLVYDSQHLPCFYLLSLFHA